MRLATLGDGNESSTFMRKLDQTGLAVLPSEQSNTIEDNLRLSVGANLLQIMQSNQANTKAKQRGRGVRNFNFRCNLDEIDKIIEEDAAFGTADLSVVSATDKTQDNNVEESPPKELKPVTMSLDLDEINESIKKSETKNEDEPEEMKRPATGRK